MYDLNMHDFSLLHVEFRVSGNSPPGDACQFSVLWVPLRNRLAVKSCIARRHTPANQISRFLMNCLSVMNTWQATRTNLGSILIFCLFWMIFVRGKAKF